VATLGHTLRHALDVHAPDVPDLPYNREKRLSLDELKAMATNQNADIKDYPNT
jgi:hypothetical protein